MSIVNRAQYPGQRVTYIAAFDIYGLTKVNDKTIILQKPKLLVKYPFLEFIDSEVHLQLAISQIADVTSTLSAIAA